MYRDYSHVELVKWDPRQDFDMFVRDDVAPLGLAALGLGDTGVGGGSVQASSAPASGGGGARFEQQPIAIFTGPFDGRELQAPTDIAIAPDGARLIADAGNDRIVVLERDGAFRRAFGSQCDLAEADTSGCVDPDGEGPLELGDGQLNEPWGVAAGSSGDIFVSDTWNHRVQRFDASGRFAGKWGRFSNQPVAGGAPVEEPVFFGPRGISDGFDDELVVADTGNKRLLVFSPDGGLLHTLGSGGGAPDQWNEPVGIAPDVNGTLLVADTWNRRIKRLDRRYAPIGNWRVPDWRSEGVSDKPFVAADENGMVYAGDPTGGRVWIFAGSGRLEGTLLLPPLVEGRPRPLGLAIDSAAGQLLVVDQAGSRVLVYGLPELRTAQAQS
jgi:DNA-binding beta-propeller fold protein YncE